MLPRRHLLPLLAAALLATPLAAQTPAPPPAPSPITPYLDNQTVLAARLDISKIDTGAIEAFINQLLADQHIPLPDDAHQGIAMARFAADAMLARFKALGGGRIYLLIAFPDAWPANQPVAFLIPVNPSSADGMTALINSLPLGRPAPSTGNDWLTIAPLNDHLLYVGSPVPLKRLQSLHPQPRPDLESPLSDSTSAFALALTPTPDIRRVVAEMMPRLPDEIGGQSTAALAANLVNVTLHIDLPPKPQITLAAHTGPSVEAAQTLADLADRCITTARQSPDFKRSVAPGGELADHAAEVNALLDALKPTKNLSAGGQIDASVSVQLASAQIQTAITLLMPDVTQAKSQSNSMSNLRQIAGACIVYSSDKNNAWPTTLNDLKPYLHNDQLLTNPNDPQHRPYILEPWTADEIKQIMKSSTPAPIAYEADDNTHGHVNVAYSDGHVDNLPSRETLTTQLAKSHAAVKK